MQPERRLPSRHTRLSSSLIHHRHNAASQRRLARLVASSLGRSQRFRGLTRRLALQASLTGRYRVRPDLAGQATERRDRAVRPRATGDSVAGVNPSRQGCAVPPIFSVTALRYAPQKIGSPIRSPVIVQSLAARSISVHTARRISPDRAAVRIKASNANRPILSRSRSRERNAGSCA